jgi:hypothetical protein
MILPATIEPNDIYDDGALVMALGIPSATLTRARRHGHLRYSRKGRRTLYLGKWIIAWLESDSREEKAS